MSPAAGLRTDDRKGRSIAPQPKVLVLTNRSWDKIVSAGTILDLEDAMTRVARTEVLALPPSNRRARLQALRSGRRITPSSPASSRYDMCLLAIFQADQIRALKYVRDLRRVCKRVVVYLFDAWVSDSAIIRRHRNLWGTCDSLFVSFPSAVEPYSRWLDCPVAYLPQAIEPRRFNPTRLERPIDVLSLGRRVTAVHRALVEAAERLDLWYHFSEARAPRAIDLRESQLLAGQLCRSAKIQICWPIELTHASEEKRLRFSERDGSPITARWFEAAACASVVMGAAPRTAELSTLFPYEGFVRELDPSAPELVRARVLEALADDGDREERQLLARYVMREHSWEARCRAMLSSL